VALGSGVTPNRLSGSETMPGYGKMGGKMMPKGGKKMGGKKKGK
jgi:hypothetical protein